MRLVTCAEAWLNGLVDGDAHGWKSVSEYEDDALRAELTRRRKLVRGLVADVDVDADVGVCGWWGRVRRC